MLTLPARIREGLIEHWHKQQIVLIVTERGYTHAHSSLAVHTTPLTLSEGMIYKSTAHFSQTFSPLVFYMRDCPPLCSLQQDWHNQELRSSFSVATVEFKVSVYSHTTLFQAGASHVLLLMSRSAVSCETKRPDVKATSLVHGFPPVLSLNGPRLHSIAHAVTEKVSLSCCELGNYYCHFTGGKSEEER